MIGSGNTSESRHRRPSTAARRFEWLRCSRNWSRICSTSPRDRIRHQPLPRCLAESADHDAENIRRAGLKRWKRVFQNLRASRQTELNQQHPSHVVCDWLGNTEAVANEHYLHTTDADFQRALQNPVQCPTVSRRNGREAVIIPKENPTESVGLRDVTNRHNGTDYPTRIRTWTNRTKICCATVTLSGIASEWGV